MTVCPRCGVSNPPNNKFCGNCGQHLEPAPVAATTELPAWLSDDTLPKASSAPTRGSQTETDELPPWLSETSDADAATQDAAPPPWLAELQASAPPEAAPPDELPPWLRMEANAAPTADAPEAAPDELPDWLREIAPATAPGAATHAAAPSSNPDMPGALDNADRTGASASSQQERSVEPDALPPWLREPDLPDTGSATADEQAPPALSVPLDSGPSASDELPDWLREYTAPPPAAAPAAAALPPWLMDESTDDAIEAAPPAASTARHDDLPPWLAEEAPTARVAAAVRDDALPSWLADEAAGTSQAAASSPEALPSWQSGESAAPATSAHLSDDALPPWLVDDEPAAVAPPSAPPSADALPPWLTDEADAVPGEANLAVPDWNNELEASREALTAPDDTALPPWLRDEQEPSAAPAAQQSAVDSLPSWLLEESPTAAPPPVVENDEAPSPDEAAELPGWLSEDSEVAAGAGPAPSAETDELPAWLRDTADEAGHVPEAMSAADHDADATEALPAWLLEAAPTAEQSPPVSSAADQAAESDVPAWLQSSDAADLAAPAAADSDEPAWLQEAQPTAPDAMQPSGGTASAGSTTETPLDVDAEADAELPAWLRSDQPEPAAAAPTPSESPAAAAEALPQGSATVELPAWLEDAPQEPAAAASEAPSGDLPPWLADMPSDAPATEPETSGSLPSWLDEPAATAEPGVAKRDDAELLSGLDLPAWLREDVSTTPGAAESKPGWLDRVAPDEGDKQGAAVPSDEPVATPTPRLERSPERLAAMQLLNELMEEPAPEPAHIAAERRTSWVTTVLLPVVALLLIAALLYVLLNNRINFGFGAAPATPTAAAAMLSTLPANRPVVLAYEWDPQRLGDLGPLEDVAVRELTRRSDVPLVLLSTDPQGALLANARAARLAQLADDYHNRYGLGSINLGFRAGGEVALRRMASGAGFGALLARDAYGNDLQSNEVTRQSVCGAAAECSWRNVGLLVLMADDVADVRAWFEQVRSEYPELPVLLLASREIGPQVQPYVTDPNVQLVSGIAGAEALARAAGTPSERYGRQLDATALGGAAFALLVLLGGIPAIVVGRRTGRDEPGAQEDGAWVR